MEPREPYFYSDWITDREGRIYRWICIRCQGHRGPHVGASYFSRGERGWWDKVCHHCADELMEIRRFWSVLKQVTCPVYRIQAELEAVEERDRALALFATILARLADSRFE